MGSSASSAKHAAKLRADMGDDAYLAMKRKQWWKYRSSIMSCKYGSDVGAARVLCDICNGPQIAGRTMSVDHCHTTGRIRGYLCNKCNTAIGFFLDDPNIVRRALAYLED